MVTSGNFPATIDKDYLAYYSKRAISGTIDVVLSYTTL